MAMIGLEVLHASNYWLAAPGLPSGVSGRSTHHLRAGLLGRPRCLALRGCPSFWRPATQRQARQPGLRVAEQRRQIYFNELPEHYAAPRGYGVLKGLCVMSSSLEQARLLFGFEPADWLFLVGGVALVTVFAAVFVL